MSMKWLLSLAVSVEPVDRDEEEDVVVLDDEEEEGGF